MDLVDLPTEFTIHFLGFRVEAHWALHAILMVGVWFVLVPISILAMRYLKPRPTEFGVANAGRYMFSRIHFIGLKTATALSLGGGILAVLVSQGFSGTLHSVLGIGTVVFGALQVVSAWMRGTHGGKYGHGADPDDPSTWHGDHYDLAPRRVWFEAYHKAMGHITMGLALGAILTGLAQYWVPGLALAVLILFIVYATFIVIAEGLGMRHDTYRSVYGTHPDHPGNRKRDGHR